MAPRHNNARSALAIILIVAAALAILIFKKAPDGSSSVFGQAADAAESIAALPDAPMPLAAPAAPAAPTAPADAPAGEPYIHIDKQTMTLTLHDADGAPLAVFGVATGKVPGTKRVRGDMRTPEGSFHISQIQDASGWTHDFGDGNGVIKGAYGPYFLRLVTPGFSGIGIHGTHDPASIGSRASEGCIRVHNAHIDSLARMVQPGMKVIITPGDADRAANADL